METRDPNRSSTADSRHGTSSSAKSIGRAEWFLAGHVLPLDGGASDHDHADSETDTAIPDDDDYIASLASSSFESLQPSSL